MTLAVRDEKGFVAIQPIWQGKPVVCIAGGPSLSPQQLNVIRDARERDLIRIIAVNDAYLLAPYADACYFADAKWWKWHAAGLEKRWPWIRFTADQVRQAHASFAGQWLSIEHPECIRHESVFLLRNMGAEGLSDNPGGICTGSNSGYQALNVAVHSAGRPILLVAYDMRWIGNRSHSHDGHPHREIDGTYAGYAQKFISLENPLRKLGVQVINCTPGSRIRAFPFGELEQALGACAHTS